MPDVKFSNQYPYTDFHELNLEWVINEVKYWSTKVGKTIQSIDLTGTVGLVDTYTITYSDGTTSTFDVTNGNGIVSITKTATVGLVDTYTITFTNGTTSTFNVTNGKGIVSITKTATVGLVDTYTISYSDGTTSTFDVTNGTSSIDEAVRFDIAQSKTESEKAQARENEGSLQNDSFYKFLNNNFEYVGLDKDSDIFTLAPDCYANNSGFIASEYFDSWYYTADTDQIIFADDVLNYNYYSICLFKDTITTPNFIVRYRTSDNNMPTKNSPSYIRKGTIVIVSILKTDGNFKLYSSSGLFNLSSERLDISKKCYARYYGTSPTDNGFMLYFKNGVGGLRYDFTHTYNVSINADCWRIDSLAVLDKNMEYKYTATTGGEWECAIRLNGRPDFSGGAAHGDEIVTSVKFLFDGTPYDANDFTNNDIIYFDNLKIIEVTNLYDPSDNVTVIAEHGREYYFKEDGTLYLKQYIDWKISDTLTNCFLAMLTPSKQYTDKFYTNLDYTPRISVNSYGNYPNVKKATQYSDDEGFCCSLEIVKYPNGLNGGDKFELWDNGMSYNKMYFTVCTTESVIAGTVWEADSIYRFNAGNSSS